MRKRIPLLPCPFCGGKAKLGFQADASPEMAGGFWSVACNGPKGRCGGNPLAVGDTKTEAVNEWNRRGTPRQDNVRIVLLNGTPVTVTTDKDGIDRVPNNEHLENLFICGALDLNKLAVAVKVDRSCPVETKRRLYQNFGYSLCGYSEIFPNDSIEEMPE